MKYAENLTQIIGHTPLVKLNKLAKKSNVTLLMKLESVNPGGSIKDRLAFQVIASAEQDGRLKKGGTIVECTGSGNTGIGLAMIAAIRGYKSVFTMPDKNSLEKINTLRAYGAKVIICPTNVAPDDPRSYYKVAEQVAKDIPGSFFVRQYHNPDNPKAHYLTTGPELWEQTEGKITHLVAGMGTGGTISGIATYLKEKNSHVQIIGVDPIGSLYKEYFYKKVIHSKPKTYLIEGIGEDFIPDSIDFSVIDQVVQVTDKQAYQTAWRLSREEGLLVGSSSGSAVFGALKVAKKLPKEAVVVTVLPDSGRSYLSKIFNDEWMQEHDFLPRKGVRK